MPEAKTQHIAEHTATIRWSRDGGEFLRGKYSRKHTWTFDGGITVAASASPQVVRAPYSSAEAVDPEEALVAAASSCHMLTFLHLASKQGFEVESYEDDASGVMTKSEKDVPWLSAITLRPRIVYGGEKRPSADEIARLHHLAHEECYIANTIKSEVKVEGR